MHWLSLTVTLYLLVALFTAGSLAKPIRRVMTADPTANVSEDARVIVTAIVVGVAAVWPVALPVYLWGRMIPASAGDVHSERAGVELALSERYGRPA
jgi:hypothetical protein